MFNSVLMKSNELKMSLKTSLIKNTGEVLQRLQQIFKNNTAAFNAVILLSQNYQQLLTENIMGMKDTSSFTQFNEINNRLLNLIDLIQEEEACAYNLEQAQFQKIIVICKTNLRQPAMQLLFPSSRWKMVTIDASGSPLDLEILKEYELMVFDNTPYDNDNGQHELLKYYLDVPGPCILYYGDYLKLLTEYSEKVYAANSIFSFHSRLQEMISYMQNVKA